MDLATLEEAAEARKKGEQLFDEFLAHYDMTLTDQQKGKIPPEEIRTQTRRIVHVLHSDTDTRKIPV